MTVDTACSSSLVAMQLAALSLHSQKCRKAIVAGVNLMLSPEPTIGFSVTQVPASALVGLLEPSPTRRPFPSVPPSLPITGPVPGQETLERPRCPGGARCARPLSWAHQLLLFPPSMHGWPLVRRYERQSDHSRYRFDLNRLQSDPNRRWLDSPDGPQTPPAQTIFLQSTCSTFTATLRV